jgi:hypothetical protein
MSPRDGLALWARRTARPAAHDWHSRDREGEEERVDQAGGDGAQWVTADGDHQVVVATSAETPVFAAEVARPAARSTLVSPLP